MEKTRTGTNSEKGWVAWPDTGAQYTWGNVIDIASRLSHLVQSGRRVSHDELGEVNREAHGPGKFIEK